MSPGCRNDPASLPDHVRAGMTPPGADSLDDAFRAHGAALLRFLRGKVGADDAPDLMQEVFVRAAGSRQRHELANPAAFLRRVAQNLLIDRSRKHKRDNVVLFPLREEADAIAAPQQELDMEAADLLKLYEGAVAAMPAKTQRVFLMHRVDELSYRQIHERLGISIATVEYHMMKALAGIARAIKAGE